MRHYKNPWNKLLITRLAKVSTEKAILKERNVNLIANLAQKLFPGITRDTALEYARATLRKR